MWWGWNPAVMEAFRLESLPGDYSDDISAQWGETDVVLEEGNILLVSNGIKKRKE